MKNVDKLVNNIEKDIKNLSETVNGPANTVVEFIKSHKKLIIILVVAYLVSRFLFSEDDY